MEMSKALINRRSFFGMSASSLLIFGGIVAAWPRQRGLPDPSDPQTTLQTIEEAVERIFLEPEITTAVLANRLTAGDRVVLLDVREADEYAQSHIPGAFRVETDATASSILPIFRVALLAGATVVVYCSVGWRSAFVVRALRQSTDISFPKAVFNLRGGIFRWHVEGRPLVFGPGASGVHPFSRDWGQLLKRLV